MISESWQASKLLSEAGINELSPMVIHRGQHFYVDELAQCHNGEFVIPVRWVEQHGILCGDVLKVLQDV